MTRRSATSRTTHHLWRVVLAAGALALVAAACGNDGDGGGGGGAGSETDGLPAVNTDPPVYGGEIVYGVVAETDGFDPSTSQWSPSGLQVARAIFDTLTAFDENGNIQPYLAEKFTPNEEFTEWTIKLRPNVEFHNGEILDADALVKNFEFFITSPLTGPIFSRWDSVERISDLEVRVTLKERWVNFPSAFTTQIGVVAAPEMLDADDAERKDHPIGTGPFEFESWVRDDELVTIRNENYWQAGLPYLNSIRFRPIPEPTSRINSLQTGDIDLAMFDDGPDLDTLRGDDRFTIWRDPDAETAERFVMLNTKRAPLDDPEIRRALAMGTNAQQIIDVLDEGRTELAEGPYRPSSPWYRDVDYPTYDAEAASAAIAAYEAENGEIQFDLQAGPGVNSNQLAQLVQEQWNNIGVDVEIRESDVATLIVDVVFGSYTALTWRQFDSPHPLQETVWWHEEGATALGEYGLNFARNSNETLSAALDQARFVTTREEEVLQYGIVQDELAKDIPYIWISHLEAVTAARSDLANVWHYDLPDGRGRATSLANSAHGLHQIWDTSLTG